MCFSNSRIRLIIIVLLSYFLFISIQLGAEINNHFYVLSKSKDRLVIQFELGDWNLEDVTESGVDYKTIVTSSRNHLYIGETPTLPIFSTMIAIPDGMDADLLFDIDDSEVLSSVNLLNNDVIRNDKDSGNLYPLNQIAVSEPGQLRDFRVVSLNVYPFQYDTKSGDISVIKTATITLRYRQSAGSYINEFTGQYSQSFGNIYSGLLLNYENVRDEATAIIQPKLLIIYPSGGDTVFNNTFNDFVTWKKQKGYIVNTASTTTTGTINTSIKSYIQTQYNTLSTRPDVVLLLGDVSGTYGIPTWSETNTGYTTSYGDYSYTLLAGSDNYGDVQIGRISIASSIDFVNYYAKVVLYEKNINLATAQWLDRMLLVADTDPSGISTQYTSEYIYDLSRNVNPNYSYTKLYSTEPSPTDINNAINTGVGIYNYRGYINMSGWSPSSSLINGYRLNHGVMITCATGNIQSDATIEAFVKLGTSAAPAGGITAIGMSTSSTHTGFNNCLTGALYEGIFVYNMRTMGEALLFSKSYLQSVFNIANPTAALFFNRICNLVGDPTVEIFITRPGSMQVSSPTFILPQSTSLELTVNDNSNNPIPNATVNLWQTNNLNVTGYTNNLGKILFTIPSTLSDSITVTVSKHNYKPTIQKVGVIGDGLVYNSSIIDDDNNGGSSGNDNQNINAGESIEYKVKLKNTKTTTINSITGTINCNDPYIQIVSNTFTFPDAVSNTVVTSANAIVFSVNQNCPDKYPITFYLSVNSSAGSWSMVIPHIVRSADLDYVSHTVIGTNNYLEVNEIAQLYLTTINNGTETATNVNAVLRSYSSYIIVTDSVKVFGSINSGSSYSNSSNPFTIRTSATSIVGMTIPMELYLYNGLGYSDSESFTLTIGNPLVTDPLGQDAYGYFIFDSGDIGYENCPVYNWIGIAPAEGGSGTALTISDAGSSGDEGDQVGCDASELVTLPFTFKYYGIDYNQITVVSNGFIAFGATNNHDFRNWRLPGAVGPNAMIAAFWDDLSTMTGGIYKYYDATNHYFIIEWYNLKNGRDRTSEETFQIILYDPAHYRTNTGDGPVKIQYKVFNNVDATTTNTQHGCYSTIGIKDHTGLIGLEYSFNNQYPQAAAQLGNQTALYITTPLAPNIPYIAIEQVTLDDENNNGYYEPTELVDVVLTLKNFGTDNANNVNVILTTDDAWITLRQYTASYGIVNGLSNSVNNSSLQIEVVDGCPNNYVCTINVQITASGGYVWNRRFTLVLNTPILSITQTFIHDANGNSLAEPGEVINLGVKISNTGLVSAENTTAIISVIDPWISIINSNSGYGQINSQSFLMNADFFTIQISQNCPSSYTANLSLTINCRGYRVSRNFTLSIVKPSVTVSSWTIDDMDTNSNCTIDIAETGYLVINIYNSHQVSVNNAIVQLISDNTGFTLTPALYNINSIDKQSSYQIAPQFSADGALTEGMIINITINITSENTNSFTATKSFRIGNDIMFYDFEGSNGGFTAANSITPGWSWGTSSYAGTYSGTKIWGCVLTGNYASNATYTLTSPAIKINSGAYLTFRHRYNLETSSDGLTAYDGGRVLISTNNGSTWLLLHPQGGYPYSNVAALSTAGYCGLLTSWTEAFFNLSAYSNQTIKIMWELKTDGSIVRNGWFLDDILFYGTPSSNPIGCFSGTVTLERPIEPLSNVSIVSTGIKVNPNDSGFYKFRVSNGTYTIKAKLKGFAERTTSATVQLNNTTNNINMNLDYLPPPIGFTWTALTDQVEFRWGIETRPAFQHYNIYRKIGTGAWGLINETTQNYYTELLTQQTWYEYKVTSDYITSESMPTQTIRVYYPNNNNQIPPTAPNIVSIIKDENYVTITWEPVTTDTSGVIMVPWEYRIYSDDTLDFIPSQDNFVCSVFTNSVVIPIIPSRKVSYYIVRAFIGYSD